MHPSCIDTNRLSLFVFAGINTMKRTSSKPYGRMAMRESTARRGFNRGASEGWRARNNRKLPRLAVRPQ